MPVRKTFRAEMHHLKTDKGMPQRQAVAVSMKYAREGKFSDRKGSARASRRTR